MSVRVRVGGQLAKVLSLLAFAHFRERPTPERAALVSNLNETGRLGSGLRNGSLGFWDRVAESKGTGLWLLINRPGGVRAWEEGARRAPVPPLSKGHAE